MDGQCSGFVVNILSAPMPVIEHHTQSEKLYDLKLDREVRVLVKPAKDVATRTRDMIHVY